MGRTGQQTLLALLCLPPRHLRPVTPVQESGGEPRSPAALTSVKKKGLGIAFPLFRIHLSKQDAEQLLPVLQIPFLPVVPALGDEELPAFHRSEEVVPEIAK